MMAFDFLAGEVILIDKPLQWTSFDVVAKLRGVCKVKKIGHAGTLDPLATGLLILCTGKKTKTIDSYQGLGKIYQATFTFGATTPTYDAEFPPESPKPFEQLTQALVEQAINTNFLGSIQQVPPIYSAVKIKGETAYKLARRGKEVVLEPRTIHIERFEITHFDLPHIQVEIACSKGTYIRSLAHDLGQLLGTGAYLSALRRTAIGEFSVEEADTLEVFIEKVRQSQKV